MSKILVIDDDRDICLLLKRFLSKHNYDVAEVYAGKKALDMLHSFSPDLVMCDFRLEDMDGATLLIKIKEQLPDVPVIIMTGYSDIKTAVEVMKLGAYDYIGKPLFPDEILLTTKKHWKRRWHHPLRMVISIVIMPCSRRPMPTQQSRRPKKKGTGTSNA